MQNQTDIQTISKRAPPTYAQAMGPSVPMRDSPYVPVPGQTTMFNNQIDSSMVQNQQGHPTVAPFIIPNETLESRSEQTCSKCCSMHKKIIAVIVFMAPLFFIVKLIIKAMGRHVRSAEQWQLRDSLIKPTVMNV